ncbi:hypothetical protein B0T19DRAFT_237023 [Cercophora scortea]|uniref:GATA-type domain-containing protein n=1 Tax=Cercophora scortea TaxID=314031 RepID=A0AAE0MA83_9PEZI|nr:hypothetical protein B0T19DRAFT_237023 [Cercophora scortea]
MATMANHDRETTQPTCHNCATSTTPLWRRDEIGSVLCNACGLFLKLHGRPRPISLKTDVIKSRNRVKTMRPDLAKQKKQNQGLPATADMNGVDQNHMNNGGVTNFGTRRPSQKSNGHVDDTNSPISRTGTPNMYNSHIAPIYHTIDDQFQPQSMPGGFAVSAPSPGRAQSPLNGEHMPPTHEQLLALNASLKTRVSELEVIQELYRGRLQQLENEENMRQVQETENAAAQLRAQLEEMTESRNQLQKLLNDSHHRERILKGRLDEIEAEHSAAIGSHDNGRAKRLRVDDGVAAQPQSQSQSQPQSQQPEPQPEPQSQPQLLPAEPVLEVAELPSESPELPDAPEIIESISNPQPVSLS